MPLCSILMMIIITQVFRRRLIVSQVTVEVEAVVVVVAVEAVEVVEAVVVVVVAVEAVEVVETVVVVEAVAKSLYRSHRRRCLQ